MLVHDLRGTRKCDAIPKGLFGSFADARDPTEKVLRTDLQFLSSGVAKDVTLTTRPVAISICLQLLNDLKFDLHSTDVD